MEPEWRPSVTPWYLRLFMLAVACSAILALTAGISFPPVWTALALPSFALACYIRNLLSRRTCNISFGSVGFTRISQISVIYWRDETGPSDGRADAAVGEGLGAPHAQVEGQCAAAPAPASASPDSASQSAYHPAVWLHIDDIRWHIASWREALRCRPCLVITVTGVHAVAHPIARPAATVKCAGTSSIHQGGGDDAAAASNTPMHTAGGEPFVILHLDRIVATIGIALRSLNVDYHAPSPATAAAADDCDAPAASPTSTSGSGPAAAAAGGGGLGERESCNTSVTVAAAGHSQQSRGWRFSVAPSLWMAGLTIDAFTPLLHGPPIATATDAPATMRAHARFDADTCGVSYVWQTTTVTASAATSDAVHPPATATAQIDADNSKKGDAARETRVPHHKLHHRHHWHGGHSRPASDAAAAAAAAAAVAHLPHLYYILAPSTCQSLLAQLRLLVQPSDCQSSLASVVSASDSRCGGTSGAEDGMRDAQRADAGDFCTCAPTARGTASPPLPSRPQHASRTLDLRLAINGVSLAVALPSMEYRGCFDSIAGTCARARGGTGKAEQWERQPQQTPVLHGSCRAASTSAASATAVSSPATAPALPSMRPVRVTLESYRPRFLALHRSHHMHWMPMVGAGDDVGSSARGEAPAASNAARSTGGAEGGDDGEADDAAADDDEVAGRVTCSMMRLVFATGSSSGNSGSTTCDGLGASGDVSSADGHGDGDGDDDDDEGDVAASMTTHRPMLKLYSGRRAVNAALADFAASSSLKRTGKHVGAPSEGGSSACEDWLRQATADAAPACGAHDAPAPTLRGTTQLSNPSPESKPFIITSSGVRVRAPAPAPAPFSSSKAPPLLADDAAGGRDDDGGDDYHNRRFVAHADTNVAAAAGAGGGGAAADDEEDVDAVAVRMTATWTTIAPIQRYQCGRHMQRHLGSQSQARSKPSTAPASTPPQDPLPSPPPSGGDRRCHHQQQQQRGQHQSQQQRMHTRIEVQSPSFIWTTSTRDCFMILARAHQRGLHEMRMATRMLQSAWTLDRGSRAGGGWSYRGTATTAATKDSSVTAATNTAESQPLGASADHAVTGNDVAALGTAFSTPAGAPSAGAAADADYVRELDDASAPAPEEATDENVEEAADSQRRRERKAAAPALTMVMLSVRALVLHVDDNDVATSATGRSSKTGVEAKVASGAGSGWDAHVGTGARVDQGTAALPARLQSSSSPPLAWLVLEAASITRTTTTATNTAPAGGAYVDDGVGDGEGCDGYHKQTLLLQAQQGAAVGHDAGACRNLQPHHHHHHHRHQHQPNRASSASAIASAAAAAVAVGRRTSTLSGNEATAASVHFSHPHPHSNLLSQLPHLHHRRVPIDPASLDIDARDAAAENRGISASAYHPLRDHLPNPSKRSMVVEGFAVRAASCAGTPFGTCTPSERFKSATAVFPNVDGVRDDGYGSEVHQQRQTQRRLRAPAEAPTTMHIPIRGSGSCSARDLARSFLGFMTEASGIGQQPAAAAKQVLPAPSSLSASTASAAPAPVSGRGSDWDFGSTTLPYILRPTRLTWDTVVRVNDDSNDGGQYHADGSATTDTVGGAAAGSGSVVSSSLAAGGTRPDGHRSVVVDSGDGDQAAAAAASAGAFHAGVSSIVEQRRPLPSIGTLSAFDGCQTPFLASPASTASPAAASAAVDEGGDRAAVAAAAAGAEAAGERDIFGEAVAAVAWKPPPLPATAVTISSPAPTALPLPSSSSSPAAAVGPTLAYTHTITLRSAHFQLTSRQFAVLSLCLRKVIGAPPHPSLLPLSSKALLHHPDRLIDIRGCCRDNVINSSNTGNTSNNGGRDVGGGSGGGGDDIEDDEVRMAIARLMATVPAPPTAGRQVPTIAAQKQQRGVPEALAPPSSSPSSVSRGPQASRDDGGNARDGAVTSVGGVSLITPSSKPSGRSRADADHDAGGVTRGGAAAAAALPDGNDNDNVNDIGNDDGPLRSRTHFNILSATVDLLLASQPSTPTASSFLPVPAASELLSSSSYRTAKAPFVASDARAGHVASGAAAAATGVGTSSDASAAAAAATSSVVAMRFSLQRLRGSQVIFHSGATDLQLEVGAVRGYTFTPPPTAATAAATSAGAGAGGGAGAGAAGAAANAAKAPYVAAAAAAAAAGLADLRPSSTAVPGLAASAEASARHQPQSYQYQHHPYQHHIRKSTSLPNFNTDIAPLTVPEGSEEPDSQPCVQLPAALSAAPQPAAFVALQSAAMAAAPGAHSPASPLGDGMGAAGGTGTGSATGTGAGGAIAKAALSALTARHPLVRFAAISRALSSISAAASSSASPSASSSPPTGTAADAASTAGVPPSQSAPTAAVAAAAPLTSTIRPSASTGRLARAVEASSKARHAAAAVGRAWLQKHRETAHASRLAAAAAAAASAAARTGAPEVGMWLHDDAAPAPAAASIEHQYQQRPQAPPPPAAAAQRVLLVAAGEWIQNGDGNHCIYAEQHANGAYGGDAFNGAGRFSNVNDGTRRGGSLQFDGRSPGSGGSGSGAITAVSIVASTAPPLWLLLPTTAAGSECSSWSGNRTCNGFAGVGSGLDLCPGGGRTKCNDGDLAVATRQRRRVNVYRSLELRVLAPSSLQLPSTWPSSSVEMATSALQPRIPSSHVPARPPPPSSSSSAASSSATMVSATVATGRTAAVVHPFTLPTTIDDDGHHGLKPAKPPCKEGVGDAAAAAAAAAGAGGGYAGRDRGASLAAQPAGGDAVGSGGAPPPHNAQAGRDLHYQQQHQQHHHRTHQEKTAAAPHAHEVLHTAGLAASATTTGASALAPAAAAAVAPLAALHSNAPANAPAQMGRHHNNNSSINKHPRVLLSLKRSDVLFLADFFRSPADSTAVAATTIGPNAGPIPDAAAQAPAPTDSARTALSAMRAAAVQKKRSARRLLGRKRSSRRNESLMQTMLQKTSAAKNVKPTRGASSAMMRKTSGSSLAGKASGRGDGTGVAVGTGIAWETRGVSPQPSGPALQPTSGGAGGDGAAAASADDVADVAGNIGAGSCSPAADAMLRSVSSAAAAAAAPPGRSPAATLVPPSSSSAAPSAAGGAAVPHGRPPLPSLQLLRNIKRGLKQVASSGSGSGGGSERITSRDGIRDQHRPEAGRDHAQAMMSAQPPGAVAPIEGPAANPAAGGAATLAAPATATTASSTSSSAPAPSYGPSQPSPSPSPLPSPSPTHRDMMTNHPDTTNNLRTAVTHRAAAAASSARQGATAAASIAKHSATTAASKLIGFATAGGLARMAMNRLKAARQAVDQKHRQLTSRSDRPTHVSGQTSDADDDDDDGEAVENQGNHENHQNHEKQEDQENRENYAKQEDQEDQEVDVPRSAGVDTGSTTTRAVGVSTSGTRGMDDGGAGIVSRSSACTTYSSSYGGRDDAGGDDAGDTGRTSASSAPSAAATEAAVAAQGTPAAPAASIPAPQSHRVLPPPLPRPPLRAAAAITTARAPAAAARPLPSPPPQAERCTAPAPLIHHSPALPVPEPEPEQGSDHRSDGGEGNEGNGNDSDGDDGEKYTSADDEDDDTGDGSVTDADDDDDAAEGVASEGSSDDVSGGNDDRNSSSGGMDEVSDGDEDESRLLDQLFPGLLQLDGHHHLHRNFDGDRIGAAPPSPLSSSSLSSSLHSPAAGDAASDGGGCGGGHLGSDDDDNDDDDETGTIECPMTSARDNNVLAIGNNNHHHHHHDHDRHYNDHYHERHTTHVGVAGDTGTAVVDTNGSTSARLSAIGQVPGRCGGVAPGSVPPSAAAAATTSSSPALLAEPRPAKDAAASSSHTTTSNADDGAIRHISSLARANLRLRLALHLKRRAGGSGSGSHLQELTKGASRADSGGDGDAVVRRSEGATASASGVQGFSNDAGSSATALGAEAANPAAPPLQSSRPTQRQQQQQPQQSRRYRYRLRYPAAATAPAKASQGAAARSNSTAVTLPAAIPDLHVFSRIHISSLPLCLSASGFGLRINLLHVDIPAADIVQQTAISAAPFAALHPTTLTGQQAQPQTLAASAIGRPAAAGLGGGTGNGNGNWSGVVGRTPAVPAAAAVVATTTSCAPVPSSSSGPTPLYSKPGGDVRSVAPSSVAARAAATVAGTYSLAFDAAMAAMTAAASSHAAVPVPAALTAGPTPRSCFIDARNSTQRFFEARRGSGGGDGGSTGIVRSSIGGISNSKSHGRAGGGGGDGAVAAPRYTLHVPADVGSRAAGDGSSRARLPPGVVITHASHGAPAAAGAPLDQGDHDAAVEAALRAVAESHLRHWASAHVLTWSQVTHLVRKHARRQIILLLPRAVPRAVGAAAVARVAAIGKGVSKIGKSGARGLVHLASAAVAKARARTRGNNKQAAVAPMPHEPAAAAGTAAAAVDDDDVVIGGGTARGSGGSGGEALADDFGGKRGGAVARSQQEDSGR